MKARDLIRLPVPCSEKFGRSKLSVSSMYIQSLMRLPCERNSGGVGCSPCGIGITFAANQYLVINDGRSEITIPCVSDAKVACSEYAES